MIALSWEIAPYVPILSSSSKWKGDACRGAYFCSLEVVPLIDICILQPLLNTWWREGKGGKETAFTGTCGSFMDFMG